jgi:predicted alpha/beta-hydrolase family hydrolase
MPPWKAIPRVYFPDAERPGSKASAKRSPYSPGVTVLDVDTPHGPARVHLHAADAPHAALMLGHGAGGGVGARDLTKVTAVAQAAGFAVALVEQPYRVAGRRSPAPAAQLDAAWLAVVERLRAEELRAVPLIVGGRSSGARVACRTAAEAGAIAVLCLAFPVHPPGRPDKTRLPELDAVALPTLVVQGANDPFGMPPSAPNRDVVSVKGNHSLSADLPAIGDAVGGWLERVLAA